MFGFCLLLVRGDGEEVEGSALEGGEFGDLVEGVFGIGDADGDAADGSEVLEEGVEGVEWEAFFGLPGGGLGPGLGGPDRGSDDGLSGGFGAFGVFFLKEERGESAAEVPFEVVGEHPQEEVGVDAVGAPVVDGADAQGEGLERAEGGLHRAESLVGGDDAGGGEVVGGDIGAHHIEAVEGRFLGDPVFAAAEGEASGAGFDLEVLPHPVAVEDAGGPFDDGALAAQWRPLPEGGGPQP